MSFVLGVFFACLVFGAVVFAAYAADMFPSRARIKLLIAAAISLVLAIATALAAWWT